MAGQVWFMLGVRGVVGMVSVIVAMIRVRELVVMARVRGIVMMVRVRGIVMMASVSYDG